MGPHRAALRLALSQTIILLPNAPTGARHSGNWWICGSKRSSNKYELRVLVGGAAEFSFLKLDDKSLVCGDASLAHIFVDFGQAAQSIDLA